MFQIVCEPIPDRGVYRLIESVIIEGILIYAPYDWNGASVPAFLWPIIGSPFDPRFMAPSLVHDNTYETGEITRKEADMLFRKLLIHNCVPKDLAETMYRGVRYFGAPFYNQGYFHA